MNFSWLEKEINKNIISKGLKSKFNKLITFEQYFLIFLDYQLIIFQNDLSENFKLTYIQTKNLEEYFSLDNEIQEIRNDNSKILIATKHGDIILFNIHECDLYLEVVYIMKLCDILNTSEKAMKYQLLDFKGTKFLIEVKNLIFLFHVVKNNKVLDIVNSIICRNESNIVQANIYDNQICVFTLKSVFLINLSTLERVTIIDREKPLESNNINNSISVEKDICGQGYCSQDRIYYIVSENSFNSFDLNSNKNGSKITFKPKRSANQFNFQSVLYGNSNYIAIENSKELLFISLNSIKIFHSELFFFTKSKLKFEDNRLYCYIIDNISLKVRLGSIADSNKKVTPLENKEINLENKENKEFKKNKENNKNEMKDVIEGQKITNNYFDLFNFSFVNELENDYIEKENKIKEITKQFNKIRNNIFSKIQISTLRNYNDYDYCKNYVYTDLSRAYNNSVSLYKQKIIVLKEITNRILKDIFIKNFGSRELIINDYFLKLYYKNKFTNKICELKNFSRKIADYETYNALSCLNIYKLFEIKI